MEASPLIVFYDGQCPFCVGWVKFLLDRDGHDALRFASLQSDWTSRFFKQKGLSQPDMGSILVWDGSNLIERSEAITTIASRLPGIWKLGRHFARLPRGLRDFLYDIVARHRYRIFGRYDSCWNSRTKDQGKFLDQYSD